MKRFFIVILSVFLATALAPAVPSQAKAPTPANAESTHFARINTTQAKLYSAPVQAPQNELFALPETYFVHLLGTADDSQAFYLARFKNLTGYVQKSDVEVVKGIPLAPYPEDMSFRVFVPGGTDLRSTPDASSPFNIIASIPYMTTNLVYYGTQKGDEVTTQRGDEWYYCRYLTPQGEYTGYVYAGYCDLLPTLTPNTETSEPLGEEIFQPTASQQPPTRPTPTLSKGVQIIVIVGISIPCILIIYLLFKPTRLTTRTARKSTKRDKDYYEL